MTGVWLYIIGIAVAGFIVYKFVPGNSAKPHDKEPYKKTT